MRTRLPIAPILLLLAGCRSPVPASLTVTPGSVDLSKTVTTNGGYEVIIERANPEYEIVITLPEDHQ